MKESEILYLVMLEIGVLLVELWILSSTHDFSSFECQKWLLILHFSLLSCSNEFYSFKQIGCVYVINKYMEMHIIFKFYMYIVLYFLMGLSSHYLMWVYYQYAKVAVIQRNWTKGKLMLSKHLLCDGAFTSRAKEEIYKKSKIKNLGKFT